jgi:hypothetical protein
MSMAILGLEVLCCCKGQAGIKLRLSRLRFKEEEDVALVCLARAKIEMDGNF